MSGAEADKMSRPRGRRELTTTQVVKQLSTGQSWLPERMRQVLANCSEIATPRQVGARNDKRAWCWMKEAATKSWRRDVHLQVSSLFLARVAEAASGFSRWRGNRVAGADEHDDYSCPWSILHNEGAGRSWVMNNTSNVSGVE